MTRGAMRATHLTLVKFKRKQKEREKGEKNGEKREREKRLYLLFTIYGDRVVGFRLTKN